MKVPIKATVKPLMSVVSSRPRVKTQANKQDAEQEAIQLSARKEAAHSAAAAAAVFNASGNSGLLLLSRELRNMIYERIGFHARADRDAEHPIVTVRHTTYPSLLYVCGQIHDEYVETMRPFTILDVNLSAKGVPTPMDIRLKRNIPKTLFSKFRHCEITLWWDAVILDPIRHCPERYNAWQAALVSGQPQPNNWTPAKDELANKSVRTDLGQADCRTALCRAIERVLDDLGTGLTQRDASVTVRIRLNGLPDPSNPYWNFACRWASKLRFFHSAEFVRICQAAFDRHTIWAMEDDWVRAWPVRRLRVEGLLVVPLYQGMAVNSAEVASSRRAYERGEADRAVEPVCYDSKAVTIWRMRPAASGEESWRGFSPELLRVVEAKGWCAPKPQLSMHS